MSVLYRFSASCWLPSLLHRVSLFSSLSSPLSRPPHATHRFAHSRAVQQSNAHTHPSQPHRSSAALDAALISILQSHDGVMTFSSLDKRFKSECDAPTVGLLKHRGLGRLSQYVKTQKHIFITTQSDGDFEVQLIQSRAVDLSRGRPMHGSHPSHKQNTDPPPASPSPSSPRKKKPSHSPRPDMDADTIIISFLKQSPSNQTSLDRLDNMMFKSGGKALLGKQRLIEYIQEKSDLFETIETRPHGLWHIRLKANHSDASSNPPPASPFPSSPSSSPTTPVCSYPDADTMIISLLKQFPSNRMDLSTLTNLILGSGGKALLGGKRLIEYLKDKSNLYETMARGHGRWDIKLKSNHGDASSNAPLSPPSPPSPASPSPSSPAAHIDSYPDADSVIISLLKQSPSNEMLSHKLELLLHNSGTKSLLGEKRLIEYLKHKANLFETMARGHGQWSIRLKANHSDSSSNLTPLSLAPAAPSHSSHQVDQSTHEASSSQSPASSSSSPPLPQPHSLSSSEVPSSALPASFPLSSDVDKFSLTHEYDAHTVAPSFLLLARSIGSLIEFIYTYRETHKQEKPQKERASEGVKQRHAAFDAAFDCREGKQRVKEVDHVLLDVHRVLSAHPDPPHSRVWTPHLVRLFYLMYAARLGKYHAVKYWELLKRSIEIEAQTGSSTRSSPSIGAVRILPAAEVYFVLRCLLQADTLSFSVVETIQWLSSDSMKPYVELDSQCFHAVLKAITSIYPPDRQMAESFFNRIPAQCRDGRCYAAMLNFYYVALKDIAAYERLLRRVPLELAGDHSILSFKMERAVESIASAEDEAAQVWQATIHSQLGANRQSSHITSLYTDLLVDHYLGPEILLDTLNQAAEYERKARTEWDTNHPMHTVSVSTPGPPHLCPTASIISFIDSAIESSEPGSFADAIDEWMGRHWGRVADGRQLREKVGPLVASEWRLITKYDKSLHLSYLKYLLRIQARNKFDAVWPCLPSDFIAEEEFKACRRQWR